MIHLKTISGDDFLEKRFALLLEPDLANRVDDDAKLNEAIRQHGGAVICEFGKDYRLSSERKRLTPEEFASIWIGD